MSMHEYSRNTGIGLWNQECPESWGSVLTPAVLTIHPAMPVLRLQTGLPWSLMRNRVRIFCYYCMLVGFLNASSLSGPIYRRKLQLCWNTTTHNPPNQTTHHGFLFLTMPQFCTQGMSPSTVVCMSPSLRRSLLQDGSFSRPFPLPSPLDWTDLGHRRWHRVGSPG